MNVNFVVDGSPADEAGIRAGDRLITIDREWVGDRDDLARILDRHSPGDRVQIRLRRDGGRETVTAELESRAGLY